MANDKYPVEMDMETMSDLTLTLGWITEHLPFVPDSISRLNADLRNIRRNGCFKHKRLCTVFNTCVGRTEIVCPDCNPTRWKELKEKKGVIIVED